MMICRSDHRPAPRDPPNLRFEVGRIPLLILKGFPNLPTFPTFFRARVRPCTRNIKKAGKVGKVGKRQAGEGFPAPNLKTEVGKVGRICSVATEGAD